MKCKNWEVGSTWYIQPSSTMFPDNIDDIINTQFNDYTLLSTCRSAIGLVLDKFKSIKQALVPAFTCHSVIEPFTKRGISVKGYPLKSNLSIDWAGLISMVDDFRPDVILIHGYFGFDTTTQSFQYIAQLRRRGILIIEDQTQTMFSHFNHIYSDFRLGSIRKWMPIPDGAFLQGIVKVRFDEDTELAEAKWNAMRVKSEYIFNGLGEKENFSKLFKDAEYLLDSRSVPHSISKLSLTQACHINENEFKNSRRNNYEFLVNNLPDFEWMTIIFPELPEDVVPFMLPVLIEDRRADFQNYMAQHNVYPTVIWRCPEELDVCIDSVSKSFYNKILCFHIDQRYDIDDMRKVVGIASNFR